MIETKVLDNQQIAKDIFILTVPRLIEFKPGQVVSIKIGDSQPRIYSIASGNKESELKILYKVKPEGLVTPLIRNLRKEDKLEISEAYGDFTDNSNPSYWIASGTGIAPFYSMFKSGLGQNKTLIHGGRDKNSFYFEKEFMPFFNNRYIRCCSRERAEGLYNGRITQFLTEQTYLPPDQKYYLCGSAEMVVEVRDILISRKIPFSNIVAEIYF